MSPSWTIGTIAGSSGTIRSYRQVRGVRGSCDWPFAPVSKKPEAHRLRPGQVGHGSQHAPALRYAHPRHAGGTPPHLPDQPAFRPERSGR
eukprot:6598914-Prymnesium_polylepis.1